MAFPQVLSTTKGTVGSNSTSHTVTLPTGISVNELIIIIAGFDGVPTVTAPAGWSGGYQRNNTSATPTEAIFWKRAVGNEGGTTVALTSSVTEQSTWIAMRCSVNSIIAQTPSGVLLTGSSTNSTFNPVSTFNITRDYTVLAFRVGDSNVQVTAPSTNYTLVDSQTGGTGGASTYLQKREINFSLSETPGAVTVATEQWATLTFALYFDDDSIELEQFGIIFREQNPVVTDAFSFLSNGLTLKKMHIQLFNGSGTGSVYAELYAHSGTYGNGVPTGSALSTSNTLSNSGLSSNTYASLELTFPFPYQTTNGTPYFIRIVKTGVWQGYYGSNSGSTGNTANFVSGAWQVSASDRPAYVLFSAALPFTPGLDPFGSMGIFGL